MVVAQAGGGPPLPLKIIMYLVVIQVLQGLIQMMYFLEILRLMEPLLALYLE